MQVIETKVYSFDELCEEAKEKAREWYREHNDFSDYAEYVIEDAKECAALLGIDIDKVFYSGFWSRGDGAGFEGRYAYRKGALKAIKAHAPLDRTLHSIALDLQEAQKKAFYKLRAKVKHSGHYCHSRCTEIWVYNTENPYCKVAQEEEIKDVLRSFMDWIYGQLEEEYVFQNSDAQVDEGLRANEYTFTNNGKYFGYGF